MPAPTPEARATRGMRARAVDEAHRVSTPLELLFDLTFVVAVSRAAAELAHAVAAGHLGTAPLDYLMIFFAIWWAWMNFTWFASAYDPDDVPYRLLTLLQMGGVLVLAAGVPAAFEHRDFVAVTVGYVIMRIAMVAQWLRAARSDPGHRGAAQRYATGIAVVQVGWVARLALPDSTALVTFVVLVVAEIAVPMWAERPGMTTWHPHHIAERYGLFTIIVLGECVLSVTVAVAPAADEHTVRAGSAVVGGAGLVLLFALWWMYFLKPAGHALENRRELSFWWGYGHYALFAALAALGAGLEVAAESTVHEIEAADAAIGWALALPVAVFLVTLWALHAPLLRGPMGSSRRDGTAIGLGTLAVLAVAAAGTAGLALPWIVAGIALPPVALVGLGERARPGR